MEKEKQKKLVAVKEKRPKAQRILSIPIAIISLPLAIILPPLGLAGLVGAAILFFNAGSSKKKIDKKSADINAEYNAKIADGKKRIDDILTEWQKAKEIVTEYESREIPDIVA